MTSETTELPDAPTMGDLVDFIHETVNSFDLINEDLRYSHNDENCSFAVFTEHLPKLMSACSSAVIVIDRLSAMLMEAAEEEE